MVSVEETPYPPLGEILRHSKRCRFPQQALAIPTASVGASYSKRWRFLLQALALPSASVG